MRRPLMLLALAAALLASAAAAAFAAPAQTGGRMSGSINWVAPNGSAFSILTATHQVPMMTALKAAANTVTAGDYPYVWGGGHASAGIADRGDKGGPGANGRQIGYDCSGSVAAVLAGAGLWPAGGSVPADNGIIAELLSEHLIARGAGRVTLFDRPGVHIFMRIDSRYFGTSDGYAANISQRRGAAGWLSDGAPDAHSGAYRRYHVRASVLAGRVLVGRTVRFTTAGNAALVAGFELGDNVQVTFVKPAVGTRRALTIAYSGQQTATGTISAVAPDGSSFALLTASGQTLTFSPGPGLGLPDALQTGSVVQVTFTKASNGSLVARAVAFVATPASTTAGTITDVADDGSTFTVQTPGGQAIMFSTAGNGGLVSGFQEGDTVQVSFAQDTSGNLDASDVEYTTVGGSGQLTATVTAIADDGSSFTVQGAGAHTLTFSTGGDAGLIAGFAVGDTVQVTYAQDAAGLTAEGVQ